MKNLDNIAADLFQKIRGRFPSVTIGDENGEVTNVPESARFFDFAFENNSVDLGKVSVSLDEENGVVVVVGKDIALNQMEDVQDRWYSFLKELRLFAKKRMMPFDVRDINKSNLNKRDYKFLATNRPGENTMAESRMYGTNKTSYQRIGNARLAIKHTQPINVESAAGRTQKIGAIYIESPEGERFKYPFRHLSGARAMARHVSEGGNAYDDFGKYISGLSEEVVKLQKFKTYMNRSNVMAEALSGYLDSVNERVQAVKKEIQQLQKESYYREAAENFVATVVEEVPEDVAENWIDQLTIKQFNEELKDVFPYIYKLVGEATKAKELGPEDLVIEATISIDNLRTVMRIAQEQGKRWNSVIGPKTKMPWMLDNQAYIRIGQAVQKGSDASNLIQQEIQKIQKLTNFIKQNSTDNKNPVHVAIRSLLQQPNILQALQQMERLLNSTQESIEEDKDPCWKNYKMVGTKKKGGKTVPNCVPEEIELEAAFEAMMGQFSEAGDHNFTPDDLQQLQKMDNVDAVKRRAIELITTKSRKPMKPEKVAWFKRAIASKRTPMDVIKLMYDLMLSGDGNAVIGSRGSMASNSYRKTFGEAYISTNKDAISILGNLRKIGKSVELGQSKYEGNLAGEYANDVWEVYNYIEAKTNGFQNIDDNAKNAIKDMMALRKVAKGLERESGSGSNAQFANQIVNTLYPVMQYLASIKDEAETDFAPGADSNNSPLSLTPEKPKTPIGEFILSYFDRETGKFPKGETAVLTAVQKEYGDNFVKPAAQFVKKVESLTIAKKAEEIQQSQHPETEMIKQLAGM